MQTKNTKQGGFTLVEIAIVLVIIGLLLGGILKGQELINNAKVRSVADRQNSLKAAWFGFVDRYNFIPGDSKRAIQLVPNAVERTASDGSGDGRLTLGESVLAMQELTGAGFLRCPQCSASVRAIPNPENSLINQYSGVMSIWNESDQYAARGEASTSTNGRLQIHSGPRIPSNILSEVDRKIDDGIPNSGDMVFNSFDPATTPPPTDVGLYGSIGSPGNTPTNGAPQAAACLSTLTAADGVWLTDGVLIATGDPIPTIVWRSADAEGGAVENNCGASVFI